MFPGFDSEGESPLTSDNFPEMVVQDLDSGVSAVPGPLTADKRSPLSTALAGKSHETAPSAHTPPYDDPHGSTVRHPCSPLVSSSSTDQMPISSPVPIPVNKKKFFYISCLLVSWQVFHMVQVQEWVTLGPASSLQRQIALVVWFSEDENDQWTTLL